MRIIIIRINDMQSNRVRPEDEPIEARVKKIKKRIKAMRRAKKYTVKEMAKALGMAERSYSDKENPLKSTEFWCSELIMISRKLDVMPGLIIADYYSPRMVQDIFSVLDTVTDLQTTVERVKSGFAAAEKKDGKANFTGKL
tara:strand:- start:4322 stop:4744 length:423 start_codon:yes stop_codon:yes gene_type:complete